MNLKIIPLLFLLFLLLGCSTKPASLAQTKPSPPFHPGEPTVSGLRFVIMGDRTYIGNPDKFREALRDTERLGADFVLHVGDLIQGFSKDKAEINRQWDEVIQDLDSFSLPFYAVPGNHDIMNEPMKTVWTSRFGPSWYHFRKSNVLFVCIDTEDPPAASGGGMSDRQFDDHLETIRVAQRNPPTHIFVVMHRPLWKTDNANFAKLEKELQSLPVTYIAGHYHAYELTRKNGTDYLQVGTSGGAHGNRGPEIGSFDHITRVEMRGSTPVITPLSLSGIHPVDIATRESRQEFIRFLQAQDLHVDAAIAGRYASTTMSGTITLTNNSEYPALYEGRFLASDIWEVNRHAFKTTVAPNQEYRIQWRADSGEDNPNTNAELLRLFTEISYVNSRGDKMTYDKSYSFFPDEVYSLPFYQGELTADGYRREWIGELTFSAPRHWVEGDAGEWNNSTDAGFSFFAVHNEQGLFIQVEARDDELVLDKNKHVWEQDGVEIRVLATPDPGRSHNRGQPEYKQVLTFLLSPENGTQSQKWENQHLLPPTVRAGARAIPGGYFSEIFIPHDVLNKQQGEEWKTLRLNVVQNDFDPQGKGVKIWWKPDWRGDNSYIGSGTFIKK